jgi:hypothetical protein
LPHGRVEPQIKFGELKIEASEFPWNARENASGDRFTDDMISIKCVTKDPANGIAIPASEVLRHYRAEQAMQLACDIFGNAFAEPGHAAFSSSAGGKRQ